jgi:hypothetical protein
MFKSHQLGAQSEEGRGQYLATRALMIFLDVALLGLGRQ